MRAIKEVLDELYNKTGIKNQKELADRINKAASYVSDLERSIKKYPRFETLELIAKAFGVSVAVFSDNPVEPARDNYPPDLQEVLPQLIEIMSSDDKETKDSLKANIVTFLRTIHYRQSLKEMDHRIKAQDRRIETLEKALGSGNPPGKPIKAGRGT